RSRERSVTACTVDGVQHLSLLELSRGAAGRRRILDRRAGRGAYQTNRVVALREVRVRYSQGCILASGDSRFVAQYEGRHRSDAEKLLPGHRLHFDAEVAGISASNRHIRSAQELQAGRAVVLHE